MPHSNEPGTALSSANWYGVAEHYAELEDKEETEKMKWDQESREVPLFKRLEVLVMYWWYVSLPKLSRRLEVVLQCLRYADTNAGWMIKDSKGNLVSGPFLGREGAEHVAWRDGYVDVGTRVQFEAWGWPHRVRRPETGREVYDDEVGCAAGMTVAQRAALRWMNMGNETAVHIGASRWISIDAIRNSEQAAADLAAHNPAFATFLNRVLDRLSTRKVQ